MCGDEVSYVVTRNINYTNICHFGCKFCAFSKGKLSENLRGRPYNLSLEEIQRRAVEAWDRGAVELCLQGGIHPSYDGSTYLSICRAIKDVCPDIHIHAFSPLEVWQGAATLGLSIREFLIRLKDAGLGTLPGTAAEILDDEVRAIICPDKINTKQWLQVVETAHLLGLRTTATIMFGHVDRYQHWARHLLRLRELQSRTGGLTEFVPLPFVPMETPIHLRGGCRLGPTFREAVLMHAVARLALHPVLKNIQTSWVKMGPEGVAACLTAGANDLGGTLMNESITRAAGAVHGEEMPPEAMEETITSLGKRPRQRTTLYGGASPDRSQRVVFSRTVATSTGAPASSTAFASSNRQLSRAEPFTGRNNMEFGITLPTKADSWKVVERAEKLGFNYAWFYDTHLLSADVLVAMGAAAMKTSKIKLCAGVFIPSNRIAPVAANALATLNALAPGRIVFGVSTGYTGRRTMGLGQIPLARLEKYVEVVEGLLAGKTVEWSEESGPHKIQILKS